MCAAGSGSQAIYMYSLADQWWIDCDPAEPHQVGGALQKNAARVVGGGDRHLYL